MFNKISNYSQQVFASWLVCLILFSISSLSYAEYPYSNISYNPRIDIGLKAGSKRTIGQTGILIPLWQNTRNLTYFVAFGMVDSRSNTEGNLGFGYRHMLNQYTILGTYGFWDIRKTASDNLVHQGTFGFELLKEHFEARVNIYLPKEIKQPLRRIKKLEVNYNGHQTAYITHTNITKEHALPGFDVEIGGSMPRLSDLSAFIAGYHFSGQDIDNISGVRFRAHYDLITWLSLNAEASYDKVRQWTSYFGVKISINFTRNAVHLDKLQQKMNQLPVRDVDVVTNTTTVLDEVQATIKKGNVPLVIDDDFDNHSYDEITGHIYNKTQWFNLPNNGSDIDDFVILHKDKLWDVADDIRDIPDTVEKRFSLWDANDIKKNSKLYRALHKHGDSPLKNPTCLDSVIQTICDHERWIIEERQFEQQLEEDRLAFIQEAAALRAEEAREDQERGRIWEVQAREAQAQRNRDRAARRDAEAQRANEAREAQERRNQDRAARRDAEAQRANEAREAQAQRNRDRAARRADEAQRANEAREAHWDRFDEMVRQNAIVHEIVLQRLREEQREAPAREELERKHRKALARQQIAPPAA